MGKVISGIIMTVVGIAMIVIVSLGKLCYVWPVEVGYYRTWNAIKHGVLGGGILLLVIGLIVLILGIGNLAKKSQQQK